MASHERIKLDDQSLVTVTTSPSRKQKKSKEKSVTSDGTKEFTEEECVEIVNRLVLDLSLVTSLPVAAHGRDKIRAAAAANSIAYYTTAMSKGELRNFVWTVQPLLDILIVDIDSPLASKAALALKTLMLSRICMNRLIECEGLKRIANVLDILCSKNIADLKLNNFIHNTVEHLATCYQELARFYPWEIVNVGALRHCIVLLKFGDVFLQTISALTMASLSDDLHICEQMFTYGAIKPLLNVCDATVTNDACMLAGLGCITQLCRISEIAQRMVQQGAVTVLATALHHYVGHNNISIREKALYSIGYLAQIPLLRSQLATEQILDGVKHEFHNGTIGAKTTVLQILMNLHTRYSSEREMKFEIRDELLNILKTSSWKNKNLCLKVVCILYGENEDREFLVENGILDCIISVLTTKDQELQEVPLVCILHLSVHPDIPWKMFSKKIPHIIVNLLFAEDVTIRELTVIVLKTFLLYNSNEIERIVPTEKHYVLKRDIYNPQLYGYEYGGLIQDYLQLIVENRREQDYLIRQFTENDMKELNLTYEELQIYQNLFIEIDAECLGYLGEDELKMLMVLKGEKLDKEEIRDLIRKYDLDKSGTLVFKEFVIMMKNWDLEFGKGLKRFVRESVKRGPIGKSMKAFDKWWNKNNIERGQILQAKERMKQLKSDNRQLQLQFLKHEQHDEARRKAIKIRDLGLAYSENYGMILPPIKPYIEKDSLY